MLEIHTSQDNITYLALDWEPTLQRQANGESLLTAELLARRIEIVDFLAQEALPLLPRVLSPEGYRESASPDTNNLHLKFPTREEYADGKLCRSVLIRTSHRLIYDEVTYHVWCEFCAENKSFFEGILQHVWLYHELDNGIGWMPMWNYWKGGAKPAFLTDLEYDVLTSQYYEAGFLQQLRLQTFIALQFYYDSLVDFAKDKGVTLKGILS